METIKAQANLIKKIMTAKEEADRAGVEDPSRLILGTIEAEKEFQIFLE